MTLNQCIAECIAGLDYDLIVKAIRARLVHYNGDADACDDLIKPDVMAMAVRTALYVADGLRQGNKDYLNYCWYYHCTGRRVGKDNYEMSLWFEVTGHRTGDDE
jgi:hypothetical protein